MNNYTLPDLKQYYNKEKEKFNELNDSIRPVIYEKENIGNLDSYPPFDFTNLSPEELNLNHFESNYLSYYPNGNYQYFDDEVIFFC